MRSTSSRAKVEAEPPPAAPLALLRVEALELLEDPVALRGRDAEALVGHLDQARAVLAPHSQLDPPALGRVLDRVVDQVDEHLPQLVLVAADRGGIVDAQVERDRV